MFSVTNKPTNQTEIKEIKDVKEAKQTAFKLAILGLGGRANYLLVDCLNVLKELKSQTDLRTIQVMAVVDNHAKASFDFFTHKLTKENRFDTLNSYKDLFKNTQFYADNDNGLQQLFKNHRELDAIWVTSTNYRHLDHITAATQLSSCKRIYMEKPLFKSLDEFKLFKPNSQKTIYIGLTLRYSTMTKIIASTLQKFQSDLGDLKKLKSWEHVRFAQAITCFMMNWRRDKTLSGGLLLEKSIHDLDLALFFLQALGVDPQQISISTEVGHHFYKKSNKKMIIQEATENKALIPTLKNRDLSPFQPLIPFQKNTDDTINWPATIDAIFDKYPEDEKLAGSSMIPDHHLLKAQIQGKSGRTIDFELDVQLGGLRDKTDRGLHFVFEKGSVLIDIMKDIMTIELANGHKAEFKLNTNNSDHADGDTYIAHTLFNTLPKDQHKATFDDPVVKLATLIGLISESQAVGKNSEIVCIKKSNDDWETQLAEQSVRQRNV